MSKSMNPIAAPKTLRYEPDAGLPVAIEAKSNRRYFYPTNGDKFGPDQTNVIRMTLNSNSFIDFSHSYLQFTVENKSGDNFAVDSGMPAPRELSARVWIRGTLALSGDRRTVQRHFPADDGNCSREGGDHSGVGQQIQEGAQELQRHSPHYLVQ